MIPPNQCCSNPWKPETGSGRLSETWGWWPLHPLHSRTLLRGGADSRRVSSGEELEPQRIQFSPKEMMEMMRVNTFTPSSEQQLDLRRGSG